VQSPAAAKKTPDDSPPTAARDEAKESEESGAEGSSVAREVTREEAPVPPDAPELDFAAAPPPRLEAGEPDYFPSGRPQRVVLAVRGGRVVLEPAPEAPLERLEEAVRAIRARLAEAVAREEAFRKRVVRDRAATRSEASLRKADHPLLKTIERHLEGSRLNVVRQDF
jgi:hypothetical protein